MQPQPTKRPTGKPRRAPANRHSPTRNQHSRAAARDTLPLPLSGFFLLAALLGVGLGLRRRASQEMGRWSVQAPFPRRSTGTISRAPFAEDTGVFPPGPAERMAAAVYFPESLASEDRSHAPAWERGPDAPASLIPETTQPGSSAGHAPAAAVRLFCCPALNRLNFKGVDDPLQFVGQPLKGVGARLDLPAAAGNLIGSHIDPGNILGDGPGHGRALVDVLVDLA